MYRITLEMSDEAVENHLGYQSDVSEDAYTIIGILRDFAPIHADDLKHIDEEPDGPRLGLQC